MEALESGLLVFLGKIDTLLWELVGLLGEWPFVFLLLLLVVLLSRQASGNLSRVFSQFRSVKLFGAEFVLSEEAVRNAEEVLSSYRSQAQAEYDRWVRTKGLCEKVRLVVKDLEKVIGPTRDLKGFRCTVHVEDVLFSETLYQLMDYYPRSSREGGRRGRRWSIRRAIIGKAWRAKKEEFEGSVPNDPSTLIENWGMTLAEAEALTNSGQVRPSVAAITLDSDDGTTVGVFYMDCKDSNKFDSKKEEITNSVRNSSKTRKLTNSLAEINARVRESGVVIQVYD